MAAYVYAENKWYISIRKTKLENVNFRLFFAAMENGNGKLSFVCCNGNGKRKCSNRRLLL